MRLSASQVIERPPTQVFRFVATEHFQNHPKWDPAVTSITQTSPGPMGVGTTARLVRTDRGRQLQGSVEVTEYQPVSSLPRCLGLVRSRCTLGRRLRRWRRRARGCSW